MVFDFIRIREGKMDSNIMQNGFYHNLKWILPEFDKEKRILINYKTDFDRIQNGFY